jgi:hypothetical protein
MAHLYLGEGTERKDEGGRRKDEAIMAHLYLGEDTGPPRPPGSVRIREHPAHRGRHRPELATRLAHQILEQSSPRSANLSADGSGPILDTSKRGTESTRKGSRIPVTPLPSQTRTLRPPKCAYQAAHREEFNAYYRAYRAIPRDRLKAQARARRAAKNDSKNRQVTRVYRRWNFAVKVPFRATFADPRRAFQAAILTRHVVAAA